MNVVVITMNNMEHYKTTDGGGMSVSKESDTGSCTSMNLLC